MDAEVVLPCDEVEATMRFFTDRLGFRVDAVFPADDPVEVAISGHGLRVRLRRGGDGAPGVLRLLCDDPAAVADGDLVLTAPNGTRVELANADPPVFVPPNHPEFVLTRMGDDAQWVVGRAGMRYRDLIPGRQGGRFIASHIRIEDGGPVPDYVHFHKVRFQLIYCVRGWVRVVYEDQGPPFVMRPGDCVLQPPKIRHRVLESSAGLEVVEISCPAEHETLADHDMPLPTPELRRERLFDGQRFLRHEAASAQWRPYGRLPGFTSRDTGVAAATADLAAVHVVRGPCVPEPPMRAHAGEFFFSFVLSGGATLRCEGRDPERLAAGDAVVFPPALHYALQDASADFEFLDVTFR